MMRQAAIATMAALWAAISSDASAGDRIVTPSEELSLAAIVDQAAAGDRIILRAGSYVGPLTINKP